MSRIASQPLSASGLVPGGAGDFMDMLIKLYDLPCVPALSAGVSLRKPIGPEHRLLLDWIEERFSSGWASEAEVALTNRPISLFFAQRDGEVLGFACHDATARGFLGPIGVAERARGQGIGAALVLTCLHDMRAAGHGYAIVGCVGTPEFFIRVAGAIEIPDSTPGLYAGVLRRRGG